jgi:hypothetical protein
LIRSVAVLAMAAAALLGGVVTANASPATASGFRLATPAEAKLLSTLTIRPLSNTGTCLDVYANGKGPWVQAWTCNGQSNQQFYSVYYSDANNVEIRSADTWCVDDRYGRGASLQHEQCKGIAGQRFILWYNSTYGWYQFESVQYPGQVWDVYGSGSGTEVQLWDNNHTSNQLWTTV